MRLLHTTKYALHKSDDVGDPEYAILSHRWEPNNGEMTFSRYNAADLLEVRNRTPSLDKIRNACAQARADSLTWLWIDSCCIDKGNFQELSKELNSMFQYYNEASKCYAFLHDVSSSFPGAERFKRQRQPGQPDHDQVSEWFERGWTLQELLAPQDIQFYDQTWKPLGTKKTLASNLQLATGIDEKYLDGSAHFSTASVATRMSWMAGRHTTAIEDIAYSMLGILNVSIEAKYGVGAEAFLNLQKAVLQRGPDESIFAWKVPSDKLLRCYRDRTGNQARKWDDPASWGLLAPSPDCFKESRGLVVLPDRANLRAYSWAQGAIQLQMPQKSGTEATNWAGLPRSNFTLSLNCWRDVPGGKPFIKTIELRKGAGGVYGRVQCGHELGETKDGKPASNAVWGVDQIVTRAVVVAQPDFNLSALPLVALRS